MIQALAKELVLRRNELTRPIESIYFGGGTPSLLSIDDLQFLIKTVCQNYTVVDNPEITLEANPDDLNSEKIKCLANSPINRLSIGIQSFYEEDLQFMNRTHTANEAVKCLKEATPYFDNITVDLIYGIPNLTSKKWRHNLQTVFDLGIKHLSSYALTVEPKTALANFIKSGKYPPVEDNLAREHFNILIEETKKHDFIQYEISNFGKENYFSKHNTSYWQGQHYLGIGPSAHSFNGTSRSWNIANNALYLKSLAQNKLPNETEILSQKERFNETIMTGLRTIWGVSLDKIEQNFGITYKTQLLKSSEKYIVQGLLEKVTSSSPEQSGHIEKLKLTPKGLFLADGIAADLFVV